MNLFKKYFAITVATIVTFLISILLPVSNFNIEENLPGDLSTIKFEENNVELSRIFLSIKNLNQNVAYCIKKQGVEKGVIGLGISKIRLQSELSVVLKNDCDPNKRTERKYGLASSTKLLSFLPSTQSISYKGGQDTFNEIIFERFGKVLGDNSIENDTGYKNSEALSEIILSNTKANRLLSKAKFQASFNSIFHHFIYWLFLYICFSTILAKREPNSRVRVLPDQINTLTENLPVVGLIGTMIGLMLTLGNFSSRSSSDPIIAKIANSAALGGVTLALTTTIIAALGGLILTSLIFPLFRVTFQKNE